ncbi:MAG: hypothetical protein ACE5R6_00530 [Candidatus Heimdallarchaeota archaeon]
MNSKGIYGLIMMSAVLVAQILASPAKTTIVENDLFIYDQTVVPDTITGPTNVTFSASLMNEQTHQITLKHFWISIYNKSAEVQSFNITYDKLNIPSNTSKTELMTVLIENLEGGDYNVTLKFGYTTPFNATEVDLLPNTNLTLIVTEPLPRRRWLVYLFIGASAFLLAIFAIGLVGSYQERKRRRGE